MLKYFYWKRINVNIQFWTILQLNANFQNCLIIFTNPSARAGYDTRSIFKQSLTGLNSEFSFSLTNCLTKAEEPSLPYYLPIAGGRIIGFIPFLRVLVQCEMQSASSRIWTRVTVSISYDDNHYTTGTSIKLSYSYFHPRNISSLSAGLNHFLSRWHHSWEVHLGAHSVYTEVRPVSLCCSANTSVRMQKHMERKVLVSSNFTSMFFSFYLDCLWDGR